MARKKKTVSGVLLMMTVRLNQPLLMTATWWDVLADSCGVHQDVCVERRIEPLIGTAGREEATASDKQGLATGRNEESEAECAKTIVVSSR